MLLQETWQMLASDNFKTTYVADSADLVRS